MGLATTEWSKTTNADEPDVREDAASVDVVAPATGQRSLGHRIVARLIAVISTLAVLAIVALAVGLTAVPAIAGGHTLTVLSGSMVPRLPVGSVVVDKPVKPESLRVGDIVTYSLGKNLITHRVVAIKHDASGPLFTTKGDANDSADSQPVHTSQIRGKFWYDVPYIGIVRSFLISKAGLMAVGGAVLLLLAVWTLVRLNRPGGPGADGDK